MDANHFVCCSDLVCSRSESPPSVSLALLSLRKADRQFTKAFSWSRVYLLTFIEVRTCVLTMRCESVLSPPCLMLAHARGAHLANSLRELLVVCPQVLHISSFVRNPLIDVVRGEEPSVFLCPLPKRASKSSANVRGQRAIPLQFLSRVLKLCNLACCRRI